MFKLKYSLIFSLFLVFGVFLGDQLVLSQVEAETLLILNPNIVQYTMPCGNTTDNACPNIAVALSATNSTNIVLDLGNYTYTGPNNTNINLVNITLTVQGNPNAYATVDLAENGLLFSIMDSQQKHGDVVLTLQYLNIVNGTGFHGVYGGVIYITTNYSNTILLLENVVVSNCNAYYGGVVSLQTTLNSYITFSNSTFTNNSGTFGSVFYTTNFCQVNISNSNIVGNQGNNGIIYLVNGTITMSNVLIDSNVGGSSILKFSNNGNVIINNMTLTNNSVQRVVDPMGGGVMMLFQNFVQLYNSVISNNVGSAPISFNSIGTFIIAGTLINNNNASAFGGAIALNHGALFVTNCVFASNYALQSGGAIYIFDAQTLKLTNTTFTGNSVGPDGSGSVLYIDNVASNSFNGVTFSHNLIKDSINPIFCDDSDIVINNITSDTDSLVSCSNGGRAGCKFTGNYDITEMSCPSEGRLSPGAIAGIIVGSIAGILLLVLVVYIIKKRHHNHHKYHSYH
ncbi:hypothetical protein PPL_08770 [Heterostelium album PN500]|uniref:Uncharacterized protein n=1 Tax=Heterostelium pallidum (strain ATCC 26659 / Pp 5 / PN500) TaxID=670386 RepID=D3BJP2_HETP5|nr:hypothetical protein PPL_08770 [Heterostelium album PN500]EFA78122.1 hypothetical protein PPL_08770 [Heterostelium album PN500]|eukprot:XP_020430248.1 hypothetical protein PPL_08770 [Heterostelium album PN500]